MLLQKVCYIKSKSIQQVACWASIWCLESCLVCNASCIGTPDEGGGGAGTACRSRTGANINILTKGFMCCAHTHRRCTFWGDSTGRRLHLQSAECTALQWSGTCSPRSPHGPPRPALTQLKRFQWQFQIPAAHFLTLQRHFQMLIWLPCALSLSTNIVVPLFSLPVSPFLHILLSCSSCFPLHFNCVFSCTASFLLFLF